MKKYSDELFHGGIAKYLEANFGTEASDEFKSSLGIAIKSRFSLRHTKLPGGDYEIWYHHHAATLLRIVHEDSGILSLPELVLGFRYLSKTHEVVIQEMDETGKKVLNEYTIYRS